MIALYILIALLIVFILVYLTLGYVIVKKVFKPKKRDNEMLLEYETKEKKFQARWLEIPFESIYINSDKGYKLHANLYMNKEKSDKFILVCHGYINSYVGQLKYLEMFLDKGYNVLIPDHRYSGESEGEFLSLGYFEKLDVIKWIDYLENRFKVNSFGIFGESMGAAISIMVAGMDKRIKFLISYCAYANLKILTKYQYGKKLPKYTRYLIGGITIMGYLCYGIKLWKINPKKDMESIKVPTLILHSRGDRLIDIANAEALLKANPQAKHYFFEDCGHARSMVQYKEVFEGQVNAFLDEYNFN